MSRTRTAVPAWTESKAAGDGPEADTARPRFVVSRPVRVSALRLTRANSPEAAAWVRGHGGKVVQTPDGLALLRPGKPPMGDILGDRIALVGGSFVVGGRSA